LKSRNPPLKTAMDLINTNFEMMANWRQTWVVAVDNDNFLCKILPGHIPTGFDLYRNLWRTFNSVRTYYGRFADSLHKWGLKKKKETNQNAIAERRSRSSTILFLNTQSIIIKDPKFDYLTTPPTFI